MAILLLLQICVMCKCLTTRGTIVLVIHLSLVVSGCTKIQTEDHDLEWGGTWKTWLSGLSTELYSSILPSTEYWGFCSSHKSRVCYCQSWSSERPKQREFCSSRIFRNNLFGPQSVKDVYLMIFPINHIMCPTWFNSVLGHWKTTPAKRLCRATPC